jgi:hypothetical protein
MNSRFPGTYQSFWHIGGRPLLSPDGVTSQGEHPLDPYVGNFRRPFEVIALRGDSRRSRAKARSAKSPKERIFSTP